jgi:hypothetical protein
MFGRRVMIAWTAAGGFVRLVTMLVALMALGLPAHAHELRPAIATVGFDAPGRLQLELTGNLEALIAGIGPQHEDTSASDQAPEYDRLRALAPDNLRAAFEQFAPRLIEGIDLRIDGIRVPLTVRGVEIPDTGDLDLARISTLRFDATVDPDARMMTWRFDPAFGDSVIRLAKAGSDEIIYAVFVGAGAEDEVALDDARPKSAAAVFADYLVVGFEHIVPKGLDHILFVVGLFLLSPRLRALLWQVSSFTLAHTITLALGVLGIVSVSPSIVEPLIAASIVYVAVENMLTDHLQRWRPVVVFGFGLLHGLGFAGVLTEFGLTPAHFVSGLVGFNLGVELGQLAVIAACFLAVGLWFRSKQWYRRFISVPGSAAIALVGFYWFIIRVT